MNREIKFRAWAITAKTMHPVWMKLDDEMGKYILMQFTGLKDKNGKEIYEGDICRVFPINEFGSHEPKTGVMNWQAKWAGFGIDAEVSAPYEIDQCVPPDMPIEVIGNIYENPELLNNKHTL